MTEQNQTERTEPVKLNFDHYGLPVYQTDEGEFAVADNIEQAERAVKEYIENTMWAFNADFIAQFTPVNSIDRAALIEALQVVQAKCCEGANALVLALVAHKIDNFVEAAIQADGRGHFLNGYDSREYRGEDIDPSFKGKLAYRIN